MSGADRIRFLNGQTTNDVRRTSADRTQESCVLNAKGHLEAHVFLFATEDAIWIDAAPELREGLFGRLERYVIADDVAIEDWTEKFGIFHVFSEERPERAGAQFCVSSDRVGVDGWDVWIPSLEVAALRMSLRKTHDAIPDEDWERRRIENGRPWWGAELNPGILPPEADLQDRAIDYEKGCYIGQEVISRMKMSGQRSKRLCGLIPLQNTPLQSGMKLFSPAHHEKEIGWVTSAAWSERFGRNLALAFVKRGFNAIDTHLQAMPASSPEEFEAVAVRVVDVPFREDCFRSN